MESIKDAGGIPSRTTTLTFSHKFKRALFKNTLPQSLTALTLSDGFVGQLRAGTLPSSLITLTFGRNYNQRIGPGVLGNSLLRLEFGWKFNQEFQPGVLPASLTELILCSCFAQLIGGGRLPSGLLSLTFGPQGSFTDKPVTKDTLPKSLTRLILGNQPNILTDPSVLPKSITELGTRHVYKTTDLTLLKTLTIESGEEKPLRLEKIPETVTALSLSFRNHEIPMSPTFLPQTLTSLYLQEGWVTKTLKDLPNSVIKLSISGYRQITFDGLPESLESMMISVHGMYNFTKPIPLTLTSLKVNTSFDLQRTLNKLPPKLENLSIPKWPKSLASSVCHLTVQCRTVGTNLPPIPLDNQLSSLTVVTDTCGNVFDRYRSLSRMVPNVSVYHLEHSVYRGVPGRTSIGKIDDGRIVIITQLPGDANVVSFSSFSNYNNNTESLYKV
ncbi:hypothetical protein SAMD00019534_098010 [Acytostelium subglobosum LB1]|uniref:hypothetical protein n=1 Tax=Acytostelium subglobosum LB1 TaxID=1410327 RepID=UPI000644EC33|nr:hypothetical protein SAMD00019534_098010 [Acytostelium subglobosum LB1]GAM26626.1 hypothetical protein SAMD00019534_098010 [Acytostelium subglobosum LB1]|eukprot:XP_012750287.1 hypothetical protein SAMD00019534_098010 [Acytostelium subglobosum LB1]